MCYNLSKFCKNFLDGSKIATFCNFVFSGVLFAKTCIFLQKLAFSCKKLQQFATFSYLENDYVFISLKRIIFVCAAIFLWFEFCMIFHKLNIYFVWLKYAKNKIKPNKIIWTKYLLLNIKLTSLEAWQQITYITANKKNKPPSGLASLLVWLRFWSGSFLTVSTTCPSPADSFPATKLASVSKGSRCRSPGVCVVQKTSGWFQRKEKSLLVLLDFSKAYDTIWRQRLLTTRPPQHRRPWQVRWVAVELLTEPTGRVFFNGELSKNRGMNQGLPQGSVLAPILFYITNLPNSSLQTLSLLWMLTSL